MTSVIPLADVIKALGLDEATSKALLTALIEREVAIADYLRIIGSNMGLYPFIVAEALAEVGLGQPLSEEERALIHNQYHIGMQELHDQQNDSDN